MDHDMLEKIALDDHAKPGPPMDRAITVHDALKLGTHAAKPSTVPTLCHGGAALAAARIRANMADGYQIHAR